MQELDRVFQRQDVLVLCGVDVIDQRGHRARLAGPRYAGDQNHTALGECDRLEHRWKPQLLKRGDLKRNNSHYDHEARPLLQDVYAEPPNSLRAPGAIVVLNLVDPGAVFLVRNKT